MVRSMPVELDGCLQVTINGFQADGVFANVIHTDISAGSIPPEDAAKAALEGYIATILPVLTNTVRVNGAHYIDLSGPTGATGDVTPDTGDVVVGGVGTEPCPPQVSYLIKLSTTSIRGVRNGRLYLPGVRLDEINAAGDVSSGQRSTVTGAVESFRSGLEGAGGGILSVLHNPAGGPTSMSHVTSAFCEVPVATQRRRLNR